MKAENTRHLKSQAPVAKSWELGCHATDKTVDLIILLTHQSWMMRHWNDQTLAQLSLC
jgi:hypothetical protein